MFKHYTGTASEFVKELQDIATGEKVLQDTDFSPKDWRMGSIAMLFWQAADIIEQLDESLADARALKEHEE